MSRFFVRPEDISGGKIYITDRGDIHHMKKVLRLAYGDEVDISDGAVWEYRARIEEIGENQAVLTIVDNQKFAREPHIRITLFQGIPKAGKMEGIIQKSVELGVDKIVPVFMERTVVVDKGNFCKKLERWQKISDEAVKQCKRGMIPQIENSCRFEEALPMLKDYDLILFPYENEENTTIKDCLRGITGSGESPETVAIIIGPEGGFSDREAVMLDGAGSRRVTLGKTILRTETAGPAAIAMTMYELEL